MSSEGPDRASGSAIQGAGAGQDGPDVLTIGDDVPGEQVIRREAVKGIALQDELVLLLGSGIGQGYKFPGGGVLPGEADAGTLARELAEECGLALAELGRQALLVRERRPALEGPGAVFEMTSRYYWCTVGPGSRVQELEPYERALRLAPEWVPIPHAVTVNQRLLASGCPCPPWIAREIAVLEWIAGARPAATG